MHEITISYDHDDVDYGLICDFIANSYWGAERTHQDITDSIKSCAVTVLQQDGHQIGFARVMTDFVYSGYLFDVIVLPEHQGKGHALTLLKATFDHPQLTKVRYWMLATEDAQDLYRRFGFEDAPSGRYMQMTR